MRVTWSYGNRSGSTDWICLAQNSNKWWGHANMVMHSSTHS
jgi:hypothetical protein